MKKPLLLLLAALVALVIAGVTSAREIDEPGDPHVARPTITKMHQVAPRSTIATGTPSESATPEKAKAKKQAKPQFNSPLPTPLPSPTEKPERKPPESPLPTPEPPTPRPTPPGCTPTPPDGTPMPCWG